MGTNKIPKRIHYCWFGGNEKPKQVQKFLANWQDVLWDYEIVEWNESNFDINSNSYVQQAYKEKKYAFVSDYARLKALYEEGGIYLDTDVEVFLPFDNLLHHDSFWGFEQGNYIATSTIGAAKGNKLIKQFLDLYKGILFVKEDGTINTLTNVAMVSKLIESLGVELNGHYQEIQEVGVFYPQSYFSPYDYINCRSFRTSKTYTMHHFHQSWLSPKQKLKSNLKKITSKVIGGNNIERIRNAIEMNRP
ncbi:glycosyl transferase [Oceanobacillus piezotolerans]|uniref:Glycosyl transferase n=1 Tax=Oceanobacillus piezotolerans TaxID=2448030 RepID=A0A498DK15_9BACI|nr:glycosyltransferase [Oceanobacillus piezotolerans]RLL42765.1 glycosyl transferase [Oceanobacillus piezotolerans]